MREILNGEVSLFDKKLTTLDFMKVINSCSWSISIVFKMLLVIVRMFLVIVGMFLVLVIHNVMRSVHLVSLYPLGFGVARVEIVETVKCVEFSDPVLILFHGTVNC